jgi:hypothetical protein
LSRRAERLIIISSVAVPLLCAMPVAVVEAVRGRRVVEDVERVFGPLEEDPGFSCDVGPLAVVPGHAKLEVFAPVGGGLVACLDGLHVGVAQARGGEDVANFFTSLGEGCSSELKEPEFQAAVADALSTLPTEAQLREQVEIAARLRRLRRFLSEEEREHLTPCARRLADDTTGDASYFTRHAVALGLVAPPAVDDALVQHLAKSRAALERLLGK